LIVRVAEGGEVLQRVELRENRAPFALMLGGPDRRTLFIMTAEWRKADGITNNLRRLTNRPRTGEILTPAGLGTRHRPAMTAIMVGPAQAVRMGHAEEPSQRGSCSRPLPTVGDRDLTGAWA
jgi:hypothetical protein